MKTHLNLGCGSDIKQSTDLIRWINVDMGTNGDLQHDLRHILPFDMNSIDYILASHIAEHFTPYEWASIKKDWYRVLKVGGRLEIRVPDLAVACNEFLAGNRYFGMVSAHAMIYGSQEVVGQMHHQGFDKTKISEDLAQEGFRIVSCDNVPPVMWQIIYIGEK
jgi:predicted SAM-dependent methyltransferase